MCAGATPGYSDEVIFGDGTFIDGSTAELSADGPLRPPYVVYCQVGLFLTLSAQYLLLLFPGGHDRLLYKAQCLEGLV